MYVLCPIGAKKPDCLNGCPFYDRSHKTISDSELLPMVTPNSSKNKITGFKIAVIGYARNSFRNRPEGVRGPAEEQLGLPGAQGCAQRQARHQEVRPARRHGMDSLVKLIRFEFGFGPDFIKFDHICSEIWSNLPSQI